MTNYIKKGDGPLIVVLHGWSTSAQNMMTVIDALASSYTVLALDLPGFGGSQQPREAWSVGDYAEFVLHVLQKLGYDQPHALIGHSFGGRVSIKGVGKNIICPNKLVLIGSAGIKHSASLRNKTYGMIAKSGKAVLSLPGLSRFSEKAKRTLYDRAGASDYLAAGTMKDIFVKTINEDLQASASRIEIPTLLVWGENDDQSPVSDARIFEKVIKKSKLHVIAGAGHFVHVDEPNEVNRLIREFL